MKKAVIFSTLSVSTMLFGGIAVTPTTSAFAKSQQKQLIAGSYTVGSDLKPGRYVVTATEGSGNFETTAKNSLTGENVNEILGTDDPSLETANVTADFATGDKIQIEGMSGANFTPAPKGNKNNTASLTTGYWKVGRDIKAGKYTVTPAEGESGNFMVDPKSITGDDVNEVLGADTSFSQTPKVNVNLHNGDKISISGMNTVNFAKR
ncbi:hypothetical protein [Furfurilactobacillus entadae]|uniref:hypothetical protein n=1 Tax=Furfurilactobacillus entadae TaxID=2922307 RepID=UPI0035EE90D0